MEMLKLGSFNGKTKCLEEIKVYLLIWGIKYPYRLEKIYKSSILLMIEQ